MENLPPYAEQVFLILFLGFNIYVGLFNDSEKKI
nr:hypothetical protein BN993_06606 [Virgibacillus halodenitrificans]